MKKIGQDLLRALNTGISYFLPVIIAGGMLYAITIGTGEVVNNEIIPANAFFESILTIGNAGFAMMVPALAGYIAYGIAGRPGLAPGLILGYVVNNPIGKEGLSIGFIGAMIVGVLVD